jgi:hypothetical protein
VVTVELRLKKTWGEVMKEKIEFVAMLCGLATVVVFEEMVISLFIFR